MASADGTLMIFLVGLKVKIGNHHLIITKDLLMGLISWILAKIISRAQYARKAYFLIAAC